jgi:hypothetical protein
VKKPARRYLNCAIIGVAMTSSVAAQAFSIDWNGFGSVYYGQALNPNLLPNGFTSTHVNFTTFSLVGLNVISKLADSLNFAGQLVALGSPVGTADAFSLIAEWAYLAYTPFDGALIKAGRQLDPVYLASEFVHVGYLLPYRQIPSPVFLIAPYTRFDGVSANYAADLGIGKLTAGVYGGTPVLDFNTTALTAVGEASSLADLIGVQASLDGDCWRVRAKVSRNFTGVIPTAGGFTALGGHEQIYSGGYRFDKYHIVSWGEYIMARTPDGSPSGGGRFVGDGHAYYLLGGYRLGKFMPRYTFSQGSTSTNYPLGPLIVANGSVTTHTFGVNYQAGAQAVIKIEYEHDITPYAPGPNGFFATQPAYATDTSGDAFYAGIDLIF